MRSALRLVALAVAALTAPTLAQTIDTVSPASGSIGTRITISGAGFGEKAPKVWMTQDGSKKKTRLKIVSANDTEIVAEVKKAKLGVYDINVQKKEKNALLMRVDDAFEVPMPSFDDVSPAGGAPEITPGGSATIEGDDFGIRKPKLKVGGKKAKVTAFDDDSITFVVPKVLHDGAHSIELRNKVGTVTVPAGLPVSGSSKTIGSPDTASYRVDKKKVSVGGFLALLVTSADGATEVSAAQEGLPSYQLVLELPVATLDESVPAAFVGDPDATIRLIYNEGLFGPQTIWESGDGIDEMIRIQSVADGVATIEFEGELTRTSGEFGKASVTISQGVMSPSGIE